MTKATAKETPKQRLDYANALEAHAQSSIADIESEIAFQRKQLEQAQRDLIPLKEEQARANWAYKKDELKGNPALFIPIEALREFVKGLSSIEQETLQIAIDALSPHYFYLGEFLFENPERSPELLDQMPEGFELIKQIMQANAFEPGYMNNYNVREDINTIKKTALPNNYGTGRRDVLRDYLLDMFGTKALKAGLSVNSAATLTKTRQNTESLVIAFNIPAAAKKYFEQKHGNDDPDLSKALDYELKRAVTRAYLASKGEITPTAKAMEEYKTGNRAVKVNVDSKSNVIKVSIPLDQEFYARMNAGRMDIAQLGRSISKEVAMGLNTVRRAKQPTQAPV